MADRWEHFLPVYVLKLDFPLEEFMVLMLSICAVCFPMTCHIGTITDTDSCDNGKMPDTYLFAWIRYCLN